MVLFGCCHVYSLSPPPLFFSFLFITVFFLLICVYFRDHAPCLASFKASGCFNAPISRFSRHIQSEMSRDGESILDKIQIHHRLFWQSQPKVLYNFMLNGTCDIINVHSSTLTFKNIVMVVYMQQRCPVANGVVSSPASLCALCMPFPAFSHNPKMCL